MATVLEGGKFPVEKVKQSTDGRNSVEYTGNLDFAFLVHARDVRDIFRIYPHLDGLSEEEAYREFAKHDAHIGAPISVTIGDRILNGELIGVPLFPGNPRPQIRQVQSALKTVCEYCEDRGTKIMGLGALLPSMTAFGENLIPYTMDVGITTGHSFTAHAIAEHVRVIESLLGEPQRIAIVGAAGSTGRAALLALEFDGVRRSLVLVDLPGKLRVLEEEVAPRHEPILVSANLDDIRTASIVICVTNASAAIIESRHLARGAIVIDDAQPENITIGVARERPDIFVIKCLARVPGLVCPFDFGLFSKAPGSARQNITFTCLAEVIALAAHDHRGHFTIGRPTPASIAQVATLADSCGIGIAPFHSFPEIGEVEGLLRTHTQATPASEN